jgi:DNA-binding response OmpR family regulator/DNA-binding CsgD family transcriptional regulator
MESSSKNKDLAIPMNKRLLIVDDEKEYLQTAMSYIIEDSIPHALLCAPNGKMGVEIAIKELPDIIIMDWEMPEMNGIEAIKQLKNIEATKDIPVIMATGIRLTKDDLKIAFDAGASDFIRKPLEKTEFISRISSHLKMADYLKSIQQKNEIIDSMEIERLNSKIDALESKKENDNNLFLSFTDTLKSIQLKLEELDCSDQNTKAKIETISSQIRQSINCFMNSCSDLNKPDKNFIKSLLGRFGNLTTGELQLCFMLKNKLSTKDIATISFREESSVKVARSRLRKKLGLNESANLVAFLEQY